MEDSVRGALADPQVLQLAQNSVKQVKAMTQLLRGWIERLELHDEAVLREIAGFEEFQPELERNIFVPIVLGEEVGRRYHARLIFCQQTIHALKLMAECPPEDVWRELDAGKTARS